MSTIQESPPTRGDFAGNAQVTDLNLYKPNPVFDNCSGPWLLNPPKGAHHHTLKQLHRGLIPSLIAQLPRLSFMMDHSCPHVGSSRSFFGRRCQHHAMPPSKRGTWLTKFSASCSAASTTLTVLRVQDQDLLCGTTQEVPSEGPGQSGLSQAHAHVRDGRTRENKIVMAW